jgi:hypothetical protein
MMLSKVFYLSWRKYNGFHLVEFFNVSSLLVQSDRPWLLEILIFRLGLGVPAIKMKQSIKQKDSTFVQGIQKVVRSD